MRSRKFAALALFSMLTASTAAAAQPAAPLSLAAPAARAAAPVQGQGELSRGGAGVYILGAVALGLIIWGIIELTNGEDDFPTSP